MKKNDCYMKSIQARMNELRYARLISHGTLMNFAGFVAAGISLESLSYNEYSALMKIAKNAYENNPSKL